MAVKWQDIEEESSAKSAVVELFGPSGTGRTHLAITAPGPLAYLEFSEKSREVIKRYLAEIRELGQSKEVRRSDFGFAFFGGRAEVKSRATEVLKNFQDTYFDAYTWAKTVIIDTWQEEDTLVRNAEFGDLKPDGGRIDTNYGDINWWWNRMLNHARIMSERKGINTIFIGNAEAEWKNNKQTGRMIRDTNRISTMLERKCDVIIETGKTEDNDFTATIWKGWAWADEHEGDQLENSRVTWPDLMGLVTNTPTKLWRVDR